MLYLPIRKLHKLYIQSLTTLSENARVEFLVPGSGAQYIDLSQTELCVKFHIILGNVNDIPALST